LSCAKDIPPRASVFYWQKGKQGEQMINRWSKSSVLWMIQILMVICVAGIVCSACFIFADNRDYARSDIAYKLLRTFAEASGNSAEKSNAFLYITADASSAEDQKKYTDEIDFAYLKGINPDVVGWIIAGDTGINYPVAQGSDNEFYLHHLFTGEENKLGSIFMDYRNKSDFTDKNTVIYGHNMKVGSMFAPLLNYKDQQYYDNYPSIRLYTIFGDFAVELFAGIVVDGDYESVRFNFKDDDLQDYVNLVRSRSTFTSGTIVNADDRIVTLCTCTYEFDNEGYMLFGVLKPIQSAPGFNDIDLD